MTIRLAVLHSPLFLQKASAGVKFANQSSQRARAGRRPDNLHEVFELSHNVNVTDKPLRVQDYAPILGHVHGRLLDSQSVGSQIVLVIQFSCSAI